MSGTHARLSVVVACLALTGCCGTVPLFTVASPVPVSGALKAGYNAGFETGIVGEGHIGESRTMARAGLMYSRLFPEIDTDRAYEGFGVTTALTRNLTSASRGTAAYLGIGVDLYRTPASVFEGDDVPMARADVSVSPRLSTILGLGLFRDRRVLVEIRPSWACCIGESRSGRTLHGFLVPIIIGFKP